MGTETRDLPCQMTGVSGSGGNSARNPRHFRPFSASQENANGCEAASSQTERGEGARLQGRINILNFPKKIDLRLQRAAKAPVCAVCVGRSVNLLINEAVNHFRR